jgi:hypothetical protein
MDAIARYREKDGRTALFWWVVMTMLTLVKLTLAGVCKAPLDVLIHFPWIASLLYFFGWRKEASGRASIRFSLGCIWLGLGAIGGIISILWLIAPDMLRHIVKAIGLVFPSLGIPQS